MKKNIDYIDSLKGIGALIIAFYHISGLIGIPISSFNLINEIMNILNSIGYIPVEMFFFFSGYLMIYNYSSKIKDIDFLDYMKKKIWKIYPFILVNLIACSIYIILIKSNIDIFQIFFNLLFLQAGYFPGSGDFRIEVAGGGTWFLAPLFFSYILFFYIYKYNNEEKAFGLYFAIVVMGMISLKNNFNFPILNGYMQRGLLGFFTGCVFSIIVKKYGTKIRKLNMFIIVINVIAYLWIIYTGKYNNTIDFIIITDIVVLPCTMLIFENMNWIQKIFSLNIFKRIGVLAMPIFFLNLPVGYFLTLIINNFTISLHNQYLVYFISLFILSFVIDYIIKKMQNIIQNKHVVV